MLTFALMAILAVLIILERCKKINLANMGASFFMMISVSALSGLFVNELVKSVLALFVNVMGIDSRDLEFINPLFEGMSNTAVIIRLVLLLTLLIPFAIGMIYIMQSMVRKPLQRQCGELDLGYSSRCGVRLLTLGITADICLFACIAIMICLLIPYLELFVQSLFLFHPLVVLFVAIFTCGLGLFWLAGAFVAMNMTFLTIFFAFGLVAVAFYVFSVILGLASCVRARKVGAITTINALGYGILCFMIGWNFIPYLILRHKIKTQMA